RIYLLMVAIRRVERLEQPPAESIIESGQSEPTITPVPVSQKNPLVSNKMLHTTAAILLAGLCITSCIQLYVTMLIALNVPSFKRSAMIPAD
ncbi:hypothetical protein ACKXGD_16465, partial [Enterococcus lactis]|uniref:hypothetical protein n=1 Tax=Enterococcus lactis TaxID=357441 RepID=UPI003907EF87